MILTEDAWYPLGCGCELSELGGMIVDPRCRAHRVLIPPEDLPYCVTSTGMIRSYYGPIDVDVPKLARGGGRTS
jgi:hypothetical protein